MPKLICIIFGLIALGAPVTFALKLSAQETETSFWELYPLFISGALLAGVFFFAAYQFHKRQKSSS